MDFTGFLGILVGLAGVLINIAPAVYVSYFYGYETHDHQTVEFNYGNNTLTFHNGKYTYDEAVAVCESTGNKLAMPIDMIEASQYGKASSASALNTTISCAVGWLASMNGDVMTHWYDSCAKHYAGGEDEYKEHIFAKIDSKRFGAYCSDKIHFLFGDLNMYNTERYNLFVGGNPHDILELRKDIESLENHGRYLLDNIHALYLGQLNESGSFHNVEKARKLREFTNRYFPESRPDLIYALEVDLPYLEVYGASDHKPDFVHKLVKDIIDMNLDGIIIVDGVHRTESGRLERTTSDYFRDFCRRLITIAHAEDVQVGFTITSYHHHQIQALAAMDFDWISTISRPHVAHPHPASEQQENKAFRGITDLISRFNEAKVQFEVGYQNHEFMNRIRASTKINQVFFWYNATKNIGPGTLDAASKLVGRYIPEIVSMVTGPFNYTDAQKACQAKGERLAMLEDLEKVYNNGFSSCKLGWLASLHTATVYGKDGDCHKEPGIALHPKADASDLFPIAYCTDRKYFELKRYNPHNNGFFSLWFRHEPSGILGLREDLYITGADNVVNNIKALYPCCNLYSLMEMDNGHGVTVSGIKEKKSVEDMKEIQELTKKYFPESRPLLMPHVHISYEVLRNHFHNLTSNIPDLVWRVVHHGWDGIMLDYEPKEEYTRNHTLLATKFVHALAFGMHRHGKKIGWCISDWGIFQNWDILRLANVDWFSTMSMTYYGTDPKKNEENVLALLDNINDRRIQIGIKSKMFHHNASDPRTAKTEQKRMAKVNPGAKKSEWQKEALQGFVSWIKNETAISQVHVWPETWDLRSHTSPYFYKVLNMFTPKSRTSVSHRRPHFKKKNMHGRHRRPKHPRRPGGRHRRPIHRNGPRRKHKPTHGN